MPNMKYILFFTSLLALLILLSSCGTETEGAKKPENHTYKVTEIALEENDEESSQNKETERFKKIKYLDKRVKDSPQKESSKEKIVTETNEPDSKASTKSETTTNVVASNTSPETKQKIRTPRKKQQRKQKQKQNHLVLQKRATQLTLVKVKVKQNQ